MNDSEAFVEAVARLTESWGAAMILPISDESLLSLLRARERLAGARIPFPSIEILRCVADKSHVTAVAARLGIAVPSQVVLTNEQGLEALTPSSLHFPLVVKPARSLATHGGTGTKLGVAYANSLYELRRIVSALPSGAYPVLLQQRIRGHGTGVFLLRWNSGILATFAHRRIREKPPSGGVSVCAESVSADPETVRLSAALLSAFGWQGPAMVEFKQDASTGIRYLMEINGRFWGSLQLAIDAGVDFPALLAGAALGDPPQPVPTYRLGVRTRWWWGEVDHLLARVRHNETPELGGRWQALKSFLMPGRRTQNEVLRLSDPWPSVRETIDWFQRR